MDKGPDYIMASREGLFVVNRAQWKRIADGHFFGVTVRDGGIYCFDNHRGTREAEALTGRIVRFEYRQGRVEGPEVLADRLPFNCHQVDFFGNAFYVVDTEQQRILEFDSEWRPVPHQILPPAERIEPTYVHMNSFLGLGDTIYLMFHNGQHNLPSEIVEFDLSFRERGRITLPSSACHDIVRLEDGRVLFCESRKGQLACTDGAVVESVKIDELFTRGLSVGDDEIAVGSSLYGARIRRSLLPGFVTFLNRSWNRTGRLYVPAAPTQIRRLDGADLSLSRPR